MSSPPEWMWTRVAHRWRWLPVVLYAAVIFGLSSIPRLPAPPGPFTDKQGHGMLYAGFAVVILRALAAVQWRGVTFQRAVIAVLLAILYGATDEWHQSFVPGRTMDAADLAADAIGASVAAAALLAWAIIRRRPQGPQ